MPATIEGSIKNSFSLPLSEIKKIIKDFHSEMCRGISGKKSSLKMISTYVNKPTGKERGKFLALDLGGTNFRILEIELKGDGKILPGKEKKFVLAKHHISGEGRKLFDFISGCIKKFCSEQGIKTYEQRKIGFTFSFPVRQTGIAKGVLLHWTKDFSASGVVGQDVVRLMNEALIRNGLRNIKIAALVNDTVGTLAAAAYQDQDCDVGVIIGTGTNACYQGKVKRLIINIEWGGFNKLRRTYYDELLDKSSNNSGQQMLEKMVSGMYLGEIARLAIQDLIKKQRIFKGQRNGFNLAKSFKSEHLSEVETDNSVNLSGINIILKKMGLKSSTLQERKTIKVICHAVSERGARISAAVLAAVITKIDPALCRRHTVAVDGSVYAKHPGFANHMKSALREIFGKRTGRLNLVLAKDGSGIGGAIIASLAASGNNQ